MALHGAAGYGTQTAGYGTQTAGCGTQTNQVYESTIYILHKNFSVSSEQMQRYIRKILTLKNNTWLQIHHVLFLKRNALYMCIGSKTAVILRCVSAF
jgi:hypothetical protein